MSFHRLLFTSALALMTGMSFVFPVETFAAEDTCECYCNIEGTGATKFPDESTKVTADRCQELCREGGYSVATCAFKPSQKPQYNVMCFTSDECTAQGGVQTATGSGTPSQPGECKQGMYYCYPDPKTRKEATLQVEIAGLKVTGDFGEYIASVYKWMLGAGTTIAIVFLMVAGLRWTLGGANAEQVGKAKKTITSAVVGLVLLLSTYLIVFTVNPYLVRLQVPAFPMIKLISLVGKESCGYLTGAWGTTSYLIKNGAPYDSPHVSGSDPGKPYTLANHTNGVSCGSVADVTKDPDGKAVADDQTCTFDYCPTTGDKCFVTAAGGQCVGCKAVVSGNPYFTPSTSICGQMSLPTTFVGSGPYIQQCFWTTAPYLNTADFTASYKTWNDGTCAMMTLKCNDIKRCEDYDGVSVSNNAASVSLETVSLSGTIGSTSFGDQSLKTICQKDPCGVGKKTDKVCTSTFELGADLTSVSGIASFLSDVVTGNDCVSSEVTP